jgi:fumarylacetoacetate (FAA) hydrolase family protein
MSANPPLGLAVETSLPIDRADATLVGRIWRPGIGPAVVALRDDVVIDITARAAPTLRDVTELDDPAGYVAAAEGEAVGGIAEILANSDEAARDPSRPWLLAPLDLQAVKAAGVTFVISLLERVIEEIARGAPERAAATRAAIDDIIAP